MYSVTGIYRYFFIHDYCCIFNSDKTLKDYQVKGWVQG